MDLTSFPLPMVAAVSWWPFVILATAVAFIIIGITKLRLHPFIALIGAAFLVGFMTPEYPEKTLGKVPGGMLADAKLNSWVAAVELTSVEFGNTAGGIAISIGLASIIGLCLMESGAADKVVRRFLAVFGEKNAGFALLWATYILSIPIFFDTMFMLMAPLAKALRLRTGKDYLLYILCICCGGVLTHSLTVPHPGPLAMVENLRVDAGISLFAGIFVGAVPCLLGFFVARWLNSRMEVPLRETPGSSIAELESISAKPESELPSFFWSIVPVLLPIFLIAAASFFKIVAGSQGVVSTFGGQESFDLWARIAFFIGNKNIALAIGTAIALAVLVRQRSLGLKEAEKMLAPPIETAGVIILITPAGGAFGGMLRNAGVGEAIKDFAKDFNINLIVLAYFTTAILRVAQGSATVSMLTASAIFWPMIDPSTGVELAFHPMYLYLAIGFAAFTMSWMNDSGFWVVSRLSGMTEKEALKSFSVMLTCISLFGGICTLIGSIVLPLKP